MKIDAKYIYLSLLVLCLPAIYPLFLPGFFAAHDAVWHIARFYQFHLSFIDGQLPVRWAPTLFNGLGYPAFIVNFHLPYYLMEAIYLLGFNLIDTYKVVLGISLLLSAFFAFLYLRSYFDDLGALAGSIFFLYSPYRFATVYARGAIGEALAIAIVPAVFWAFAKWSSGKIMFGPVFGFTVFLLIISHPNVFLIFSPLILLNIFITLRKNTALVIKSLFWFMAGIFASAFELAPYLFERKYMLFDEVYKNVYLGHFPNLFSVFRLPVSNADIGTPFQVGIIGWLVSITAFCLWFFGKRKFQKKELVVFLGIISFLLGFALMGKYSLWIWQNFPLLSNVLFPWRFINLLVFGSMIFAGYTVFKSKSKIVAFALIVLVIFVSRHFWGWSGNIPKDDEYYQNYSATTTAEGEFTPKNLAEGIELLAEKPLEVIAGDANFSNQKLENNRWQFSAITTNGAFIKLSKLYFPGWKANLDSKPVKIISDYQISTNDYHGLIVLYIPSGTHNVDLGFGETKIRLASDYLTLVFVTFLFLSFYLRSRRVEHKM